MPDIQLGVHVFDKGIDTTFSRELPGQFSALGVTLYDVKSLTGRLDKEINTVSPKTNELNIADAPVELLSRVIWAILGDTGRLGLVFQYPADQAKGLKLPGPEDAVGFHWYCLRFMSAAQASTCSWHQALFVNWSSGFGLGYRGPLRVSESGLMQESNVSCATEKAEHPFLRYLPFAMPVRDYHIALLPCGYECQSMLLASEELTGTDMLQAICSDVYDLADIVEVPADIFLPLC